MQREEGTDVCELLPLKLQESSKALVPAGTPLEEYNEMKQVADSLRQRHLASTDARSRYAAEECFHCCNARHQVMNTGLPRSIDNMRPIVGHQADLIRSQGNLCSGVIHCCLCRTFSFDSFSSWTKQSEATKESPAALAEKLLKAQILTIEGGSESNSWAGYEYMLEHPSSACTLYCHRVLRPSLKALRDYSRGQQSPL